MLAALEDADRKRLHITHWKLNYAARNGLFSNRDVWETFHDPKRTLDAQEFFGIPFTISREPGETPTLTRVFEQYGTKGLLIHNYDGPILHGRALDRFQAATQSQNSDS